MQLTATEFAKLINDLKADARPDERRTNPRAPTRAVIEVICIDPDAPEGQPPKPEQWRVRDISRTGMGMLTNRKIEERSRLVVLLPKTATEVLTLLCDVVRSQRLPGDMYHLGLQMLRRVSPIDYSRFATGSPGAAAALLRDDPALTAAA